MGGKSQKKTKLSARFLIEIPNISKTNSKNNIHLIENGKETVIIFITNENMHEFFSKEVLKLIDFITK